MSITREPVRLAQRARELRAQMEALELQAKALGEQARQLEESEIPDAMDEAGITSLTLDDGTVLSVKPVVAASIPAKYRPDALRWLTDHGHAGLIKTEVSITVPRKDRGLVPALLEQLRPLGYSVEATEGVHAQTLAAWVREYLEQDAERTQSGQEALPNLPMEWLGVFIGRRATFKAPKKEAV
jgi:hypothetical protein